VRNREQSTRAEVLKQHARDLRRNTTPAECILWQKLRGRQMLGLRFRRQEPVGPFIADFLCVATRLIIELDGTSHEGKAEPDVRRQRYFESQGWTVLRFYKTLLRDSHGSGRGVSLEM